VFRGRFWKSYEQPVALVPNAVTPFRIDLHTQSYRFQKGHRIMVQVQSTWFPIIDRNPQTWVPNIFQAKEGDFQPQTHRVWRVPGQASRVEVQTVGDRVSRVEVPALTDPVSTRRERVDLSGSWATGSSGEPAEPRITVPAPCHYTPPAWVLEQNGDSVRAYSFPEHRERGIAETDRSLPTPAVGRFSGGRLTMRLGRSRYVLYYDSSTGHLRGTFDGQPFWAVPQEVVQPAGCIPPR
jgi:hypothetical protein